MDRAVAAVELELARKFEDNDDSVDVARETSLNRDCEKDASIESREDCAIEIDCERELSS